MSDALLIEIGQKTQEMEAEIERLKNLDGVGYVPLGVTDPPRGP